jgi:SAM-dependent methyltransferase
VWRAIGKAAILTVAGHLPGGPHAYRAVTRGWLGTQRTHVDKLARVWPGYVEVWRELVDLEGADVWVYEGGWTPFPSFANHLVTGKAGMVTNRDARLVDRYLAPALEAAVACPLPDLPGLAERRARLEELRRSTGALAAVEGLGGRVVAVTAGGGIALPDASVDLCHSGGVLEHHRPFELLAFLRECRRVLRPGALMSHVVDHRDHLYHADPALPFLNHLRFGDTAYRALLGHPLLYHNRLLPPQVAALLEGAGFERVAIRRMLVPSHRYVATEREALDGAPGIERCHLAAPFRAASDADLRTAAAHYLYRNPTPPTSGRP